MGWMMLGAALLLSAEMPGPTTGACVSYLEGPNGAITLPVSLFHQTGVPGDTGEVALRVPLTGLLSPFDPGGAPDLSGDELEMFRMGLVALFDMDLATGTPRAEGWPDPDMMRVMVHATAAYPVFSRLAEYGGQAPLVLKHRPDGTSYHAAEGYAPSGETLPGGWRGVVYSTGPARETADLFVKGPDGLDMDAVMVCAKLGTAERPTCRMTVKVEPLFLEA